MNVTYRDQWCRQICRCHHRQSFEKHLVGFHSPEKLRKRPLMDSALSCDREEVAERLARLLITIPQEDLVAEH